jgi:hypothetical protein
VWRGYSCHAPIVTVLASPIVAMGFVNSRKMRANKYYCKHCGKAVERDSDKQWVKSYCDKADKTVHLQRIKLVSPGKW